MSTQPKPDYIEDSLSEEAVCEYLAGNPDFFIGRRRGLFERQLSGAT